MRRITQLAAVVGVALAMSAPAGAFHDPGFPVLFSQSLSGPGWAVAEATATAGASLDFEIEQYYMDGNFSADSLWVYQNGQFVFGFGGAGWSSGRRVVVRTPVTGDVFRVDERPTGSSGGGVAVTFSQMQAGTYKIVAIWNGEGTLTSGHVTVSGVDVALDDARSGSGGFLHLQDDFEPAAEVSVDSGFLVGAGVVAQGAVTETVGDPLYALFIVNGDLAMSSYEGPDGGGDNPWFFSGMPAGTYTFKEDLRVGTIFQSTYLFGAGVPNA